MSSQITNFVQTKSTNVQDPVYSLCRNSFNLWLDDSFQFGSQGLSLLENVKKVKYGTAGVRFGTI